MFGNCRICFQYRGLDNSRVCKRCNKHEEDKVPKAVRLAYHQGLLRPEVVGSGNIISKEEWFYIKRRIDKFYASVSSDDIDWINKQKREEFNERGRRVSGYIYLMRADNGYYKIGRTIMLEKRVGELMREYPLKIEVIHSFYCRDSVRAERRLLSMFEDKRLQGEWFGLESADIEYIMGITTEIAVRLF